MKCTICGHEPLGIIGDESTFPVSYLEPQDTQLKHEGLCRTHAFLVSLAVGREINKLKQEELEAVS